MTELANRLGLSELMLDYKVWPKTGALVVIAPTALVPVDTMVWHFATILGWANIGKDVSIGAMAEIGRSAMIGDGSRISRGVFLPSHAIVGKDVFIGPGVVFTDDRYPRVLPPGEHYHAEPPTIEDGAAIGAGAVILPGVTIGAGALVAAGAIVTSDVAPGTLVIGGPARETTRRQSNVAQLPESDSPSRHLV